MNPGEAFEIFLVATPGFEPVPCAEAVELWFADPKTVTRGVSTNGTRCGP